MVYENEQAKLFIHINEANKAQLIYRVSFFIAIKNSEYTSLIHYDQNKPVHVLEVFYVCQTTSSGRGFAS